MDGRPTILIATTNQGKLREVRSLLADLPLSLESLGDHPSLPEPVEDADSFEGNARIKALHYAELTGRWTLADDSGLEVDALGGAPGIHSARYAGEARDDAANNAKLIAALAGIVAEGRTARFRCAVALALDGKVQATADGCVEGTMIDQPRGNNGFGYDPHFLLADCALTAAELAPDEKNRISHRGQALRAIRPAIVRLAAG